MTPTLYSLAAPLNCQLAVYETGTPTGPPLLLLPGNSLSVASTYSALWNDPALTSFRVVAFDWPGCGASPWAPAAYGLSGLRQVLLAAWAALHLPGALVVAHSLAGHVLLDVLAGLPQVRGALLVGAPPVADAASLAAAFGTDPRMGYFYQAELPPTALEELLAFMLVSPLAPEPAGALRQALVQSDPAFRTTLGASLATGNLLDEVAIAAATPVPLAFAQGTAEALVQAAYFDTLPASPSRFGPPLHLLPGAAHLPMLETPAAFVQLVLALAAATAPPPL